MFLILCQIYALKYSIYCLIMGLKWDALKLEWEVRKEP
jgi:hypothetical protein